MKERLSLDSANPTALSYRRVCCVVFHCLREDSLLPGQDPISQLLRVFTICLLVFVLLLLLAGLLTKYSRGFNRLERQVREVAGDHALLFIVNVTVGVSMFLLAFLCWTLDRVFEWEAVGNSGRAVLASACCLSLALGCC